MLGIEILIVAMGLLICHCLLFMIAGVRNQSSQIPLRFFIEQLSKDKKIVFTGTTTNLKVCTVLVYSFVLLFHRLFIWRNGGMLCYCQSMAEKFLSY